MNTPATTATTPALRPEIIASLVLNGDLARLSPQAKVEYYNYRCAQAELDPAAKPFDILKLNGKEILYANAGAAQQLRANRKLSARIIDKQRVEDVYSVWYEITGADGTVTQNMGSVSLINPEMYKDKAGNWVKHPRAGEQIKGEELANAMMKCATKALRRSILAHCGLGMLDEDEVINQAWAQPQTPAGAILEKMPVVGVSPASTDGDGNTVYEWTEENLQAYYTAMDKLSDLWRQAGRNEDDFNEPYTRYEGQRRDQEDPEKVLNRIFTLSGQLQREIEKQEAKA